jgi:hypothetical protein
MAKVTYYAIVDDHTSRDAPAGVLRHFEDGEHRDESFGRDLEWRFSTLRHSLEHGDTEYELIPVGEEEATRIMELIRSSRTPAGD